LDVLQQDLESIITRRRLAVEGSPSPGVQALVKYADPVIKHCDSLVSSINHEHLVVLVVDRLQLGEQSVQYRPGFSNRQAQVVGAT